MYEKYKGKYRIASTRLQNWEYRWDGAYFITICTKNWSHFFGEVVNGKMNLSNAGVIADIFWYEIKNHAKNIELGEFVVMPNHIHGILILTGNDTVNVTDAANVETRHALSLLSQPPPLPPKTIGQKRLQNQEKKSISSIIGGYKSVVTRHANRLGFPNGWQERFWDHIIRDEQGYLRISDYIRNNSMKWEKDKFYDESDDNRLMEPPFDYGKEKWMV